MHSYKYVVGEISRVEETILGVKQEIKTLKNRVRAYKGWTKKYRQQKKELEQANLAIVSEKDDAKRELQQLQIKQRELLEEVKKGINAKEDRDKALLKLDEVISKIEQYREICDRYNKIAFARKEDLIKEAEKLFFDEPIIVDLTELDRDSQPQMFTDSASVNRYLLDR